MEEWKKIKGYEGLYEISSLGRVKSFWFGKEKIMTPRINHKGYLRVLLCKDRKQKLFLISRLVADAFIEKTDYNQNYVDHINHVSTDNSVGNLRWVTRSQNNMNAKTRKDNTSGHRGICWYKKFGKWHVRINVNKKQIHGGYFVSLDDAIKKRDELEKQYYGEYAYTESQQIL